MNQNYRHTNGNGDHKQKKKKSQKILPPKTCCMTLQQKLEELCKKTDRKEELLESIKNKDLGKINEFNFNRYIPILVACYQKRNYIPEECWFLFKKKITSVISNINPNFFTEKNSNNLLEKFSDNETIKEIIIQRQEKLKQISK